MNLPDLPHIESEDIGLKDDQLQSLAGIHENAAEMLAFYDKQLSEGTVQFHSWQLKVLKFLCYKEASDKHPCKFVLNAANGSGKDSFVVTPFAVFMALCNIKCRIIITSSSGPQLTTQTEAYIKALCEKINKFWNNKIFKINQRYVKCLLSGSEVVMFATDEAGRAEGFHPMEPGTKLVLIANECKSIKDEIFGALGRCTGYTHYLMVSSPGEPKGDFYWAYNNWPNTFRVRSVDCPHLNEEERKADEEKWGLYSAYYRSKHEALFTSIGGQVVIPEDMLDKCISLCKVRIGDTWPKEVGIDLAAGGDENVVSIWQGNKRIARLCFQEIDTTKTAERISEYLKLNGIPKDSTHIKADDGGVGRAIIDMLRRMGWNIRRILNQTPAFNHKEFGNKGAEMWWNVQRLTMEAMLLWTDGNDKVMDKKTREQLTSRHYKQTEGGNNRIFLQSKKEAKSEGHPSPDRADADVLALCDYRLDQFLNANKKEEEEPKPKELVHDVQTLVNLHDKARFDLQDEIQLAQFHNAQVLREVGLTKEIELFTDPSYMNRELNQPQIPRGHQKLIYGSLMAALEN